MRVNITHRIKSMKYATLSNFIKGGYRNCDGQYIDVFSPLNGDVISKVPLSSADVVNEAVAGAKQAFPAWAERPIKERAQVFYRYRNLLEKHFEELAALISEENGKTKDESRAEISVSIEMAEFATSLPQLCVGEINEVSRGVACRSERHPLGVVASITPFNFPNMVPNWTVPNAITSGNTMILKPSEQVPLSGNRIAELLSDAGLPEGVFNVVHGGREAVESICDHPGIDAVSFVGSTKVAKIVYRRATANFKRVLCLGGAKNHLIVTPDANEQTTVNGVISSSMGSAGQRCMAASVMVGVDNVDGIIDAVVNNSRNLKLGEDMGAVISAAAKDRISSMIDEAEQDGAQIILDGRNVEPPANYENGYWLGPTIIDQAKPDMTCAQEEIFGPVLTIVRAGSLEEAIEIENGSLYGNAASVFTTSGSVSRYVSENASAGMVGVNVGVPVPRDPFSFGGWNRSKYGHGDITGTSGLSFWTDLRKVTTRWPAK